MNIAIENIEPLLQGLGLTLLMTLVAGIGSLILGVFVTVARISPVPSLRAAAFAYVQFFINVPLLALLILAVFALPAAGLILPVVPTVIIVLTVYEAAYVSEAVRSGVNTVSRGQIEAARALGLTLPQSLRWVIVPQAFRSVVQPLGNIMIALAMNTSLAAVVGVLDLTAPLTASTSSTPSPSSSTPPEVSYTWRLPWSLDWLPAGLNERWRSSDEFHL